MFEVRLPVGSVLLGEDGILDHQQILRVAILSHKLVLQSDLPSDFEENTRQAAQYCWLNTLGCLK